MGHVFLLFLFDIHAIGQFKKKYLFFAACSSSSNRSMTRKLKCPYIDDLLELMGSTSHKKRYNFSIQRHFLSSRYFRVSKMILKLLKSFAYEWKSVCTIQPKIFKHFYVKQTLTGNFILRLHPLMLWTFKICSSIYGNIRF